MRHTSLRGSKQIPIKRNLKQMFWPSDARKLRIPRLVRPRQVCRGLVYPT